MKKGFLKVYSIIAWFTMLITSIIITPFFLLIWVLTFWWDKRRVISHGVASFWAWHYQSLIVFWKLRLKGRNKIPKKRPVVLVANHRSLVDILALHKVRRTFRWVSKAENFKLPFIGMVLTLNNCIKVNRESMRSGQQFITQAEKEMRKGSSVMIFPEGTRSKSHDMRSFMDGAFVLAKKMNCGIIPIVHIGTEHTFPRGKGGWILMGKALIKIQVLDEIPAEKVREMDTPQLKDYVRKMMEKGILELERSGLEK
ncbi:MAG: lysophospholipid acyltransferase family protein [Bacteroidales bacterium]|jgi:1-acyl-sn-glycerol-3-phosphate acyltransferase|nr:lysophospholipid acyltransferase family protein [Bacteroidales bacterium]